jgi:preprotein translocase subunit Sec61beta
VVLTTTKKKREMQKVYKSGGKHFFMPKRKRAEGGALPPTGAGLIRYFDEDTRGFKLKPLHIIIVAAAIVVMEIVLRLVGVDILGF